MSGNDTNNGGNTSSSTNDEATATDVTALGLGVAPRAVSAFSGRLQFLEKLTAELPTNEFGLPLGIYRLDLIPNEPTREELRNAFVPLTYNEGFPAFADGRPLWSHLPFEPAEAFQAFDGYLRLPLYTGSGSRSLFDLTANANDLGIPNNIIEPEALQHFYFGYFWDYRVKAYDMWSTASRRKAQEIRAVETLDSHYFKSRALMKRLMQYLEDEEEFWDLMTPKVAIDFYNKLVATQRISAGLNTTGGNGSRGSNSDESNEGASVEILFRNLAQQNADAREGITIDQSNEALQQALDDPQTAEMAQELIIKLNNV